MAMAAPHSLLILLLCLLLTSAKHFSASPTQDSWTQWLQFIHDTSDDPPSSSFLPSLLSLNTTISPDSCRLITVAKDGSGNFTSIQAAIDEVVPINNTICTFISIKAGVYREKVSISKKNPFITLMGERGHTMIVWNDTAGSIGAHGLPLKTFHSATVSVNAKYFTARNIIFKNEAPPPQPGQVGGQAVALRISGDSAAFFNCRFYSHQDTLYDHKGRHFFKNCYIEGTVDFIFGNGRSLYKDCVLHAVSLGPGFVGSVTAQKRNATTLNTGFSFVNCKLVGDGNVYLGRAWGIDSRVVFAFSWLDKIVVPEGWNDWGVPSRQRSVFYGQYKCWGPGADTSKWVPWAHELTEEQAEPFLSIGFINGISWLTQQD